MVLLLVDDELPDRLVDLLNGAGFEASWFSEGYNRDEDGIVITANEDICVECPGLACVQVNEVTSVEMIASAITDTLQETELDAIRGRSIGVTPRELFSGRQ